VIVFLFYVTAMALVMTLCAVIADLWLAHDQRKERDQARAQMRAQRLEERER
jgi:hypothetical protein